MAERSGCCRSRYWPEVRGGKDERQIRILICVSLSEWVVGKGILGARLEIDILWDVKCGGGSLLYSTVHRVDGLGY